jgi:hypothetical protein
VNTTRIIAAAALIVAGAFAPHAALAQWAGIKRTDLQRSDLSFPGREVIQVLVEFAPGVVAPNHSHPGEEIAYVIEGSFEYVLEGRPPVILNPGDALFRWGYANFRYDAKSDTWTSFGDGAEFQNACHACHTIVKANDFVFTHYPKR